MITPSIRRWDPEAVLVGILAAGVSLIAFLFYFRHGYVLLYGDAVAHINIARRVFDSRTPGPLQLGTVWLPLPHLLMMPFLFPSWAWRTGVGGSIPSLIAYVAAAVGVFRLVRNALSLHAEPDGASRFAAWLATAVFAANPNLVYLQTTAMTEAIYLALFVWAVVYFQEFAQSAGVMDSEIQSLGSRSLLKCGLCLAGTSLTRYDGWFASAAFVGVALLLAVREGRLSFRGEGGRLQRDVSNFIFVTAVVPVLWLGYNGIVYRNPLEFANGPYSARAIEKKTAVPGFPPHPGSHDPYAAARYFVKSAEANMAEGNWQRPWVLLAALGSLLTIALGRRLGVILLLWVPLPFYMLSISYGGVPLFVPTWWPFSYYNVRYGVQLLPAMAVFVALAVYFLATFTRLQSVKVGVGLVALVFVAVSYASVWRAQPVSFREAWVNARTRVVLEAELARNLRMLPPDSTLLMYLGDHVGALQDAGIPLRRTINEGSHRTWKQPSDPEGLWERALANPAEFADYAIGIGNDPVALSARQHELKPLAIIETPGQPPATIYVARPQ